MDKTSTLPTVKTENPESPKAASSAPVESAKKIIDLNKPVIKEAITKGKALIKDGKSKVEAAMLIFEALKDEDSEVIVAAFVQGAALTEKGAVTYFYNCRRKAKKIAKPV
jgi:transcriptional/translational regulatory protein YebC/TACO1